MNEIKGIYTFNNVHQYLEIDFQPVNGGLNSLRPWKSFVFDENWSDIVTAAGSRSDELARIIEYVIDSLQLRGKIAVLSYLPFTESLPKAMETSLFYLQALLYSSAVLVIDQDLPLAGLVLQKKMWGTDRGF
jgi:hypothetical protein